MGLITSGLLSLRHDPRVLLKLPRYLSIFCIIAGVAWLAILPLDLYSRRTYISENALLPGQVNTYFRGSEHNVFRAYRHEVGDAADSMGMNVTQRMLDLFRSQGYQPETQKYNYTAAGRTRAGENIYAILKGPRADATEAIVLLAAWRNFDNAMNYSGVALLLTLARYFKRWSLWSKDVIFVITADSVAGPQAWVDAYHSMHSPNVAEDLTLKSGALQGAIAIDYVAPPGGWRFDNLHVVYDGVNGQQPNLDLVNTVISISEHHEGVPAVIQRVFRHGHSYRDKLETVFRGVLSQGIGRASGPHSAFMPYHIDAVTLQAVGDGHHDEMSFGRVLEGATRSLNNLLEHLHQSFFFYLLIGPKRFVSIGTFLPSAMLIAANFTITALALWVQTGVKKPAPTSSTSEPLADKLDKALDSGAAQTTLTHRGRTASIPVVMLETHSRRLLLPLALVALAHVAGLMPLYTFHTLTIWYLPAALGAITVFAHFEPYALATLLIQEGRVTRNDLLVAQSASNLILGITISTLSTLNFSLGLLVGLLAAPLSFIQPLSSRTPLILRAAQALALHLFAPTTLIISAVLWKAYTAHVAGFRAANPMDAFADAARSVLSEAAWSWAVEGNWAAVVLWCVWWPSWLVAAVVAAAGAYLPLDEPPASEAKVLDGGKTVVVEKVSTAESKHGRGEELVALAKEQERKKAVATPQKQLLTEESASTGRSSGKAKKRK